MFFYILDLKRSLSLSVFFVRRTINFADIFVCIYFEKSMKNNYMVVKFITKS